MGIRDATLQGWMNGDLKFIGRGQFGTVFRILPLSSNGSIAVHTPHETTTSRRPSDIAPELLWAVMRSTTTIVLTWLKVNQCGLVYRRCWGRGDRVVLAKRLLDRMCVPFRGHCSPLSCLVHAADSSRRPRAETNSPEPSVAWECLYDRGVWEPLLSLASGNERCYLEWSLARPANATSTGCSKKVHLINPYSLSLSAARSQSV